MDLVGSAKTDELVDQFIGKTERGESILRSLWTVIKRVVYPILWKGLWFGFGNYFGALFCSYWILPKLHLGKYAIH